MLCGFMHNGATAAKVFQTYYLTDAFFMCLHARVKLAACLRRDIWAYRAFDTLQKLNFYACRSLN